MSSNVPPGADLCSDAPWNHPFTIYRTCPCCGGAGRQFYACNVITGSIRECTQEEYDTLPEEDTLDGPWVKDGSDLCPQCDGEGEIEIDSDYDPDDYLEY